MSWPSYQPELSESTLPLSFFPDMYWWKKLQGYLISIYFIILSFWHSSVDITPMFFRNFFLSLIWIFVHHSIGGVWPASLTSVFLIQEPCHSQNTAAKQLKTNLFAWRVWRICCPRGLCLPVACNLLISSQVPRFYSVLLFYQQATLSVFPKSFMPSGI